MEAPEPTFPPLFFDVFAALPRQGPGSTACTRRALALCRDLPGDPAVLDLGCGGGAQTLVLAAELDGPIVAVDREPRLIARLRDAVDERGLEQRVRAVEGDLLELDEPPASFDLVWSEGALYGVGLERGLELAHRCLRPGGYLAFTDAVWRVADPPAEVRACFADYPGMGSTDDVTARVQSAGLEPLEHFTLPDEAWWADFYTPMRERIEALRARHADDGAALAALDELAREPELHARHSQCYGYEFFVARRPS